MKLVLLPGMDGTGELFDPFLASISGSFEPIVVDYPPNESFGYERLEEVARANLPADGPYVLLAESFSGPIAISIAASVPKGLVALVLCCHFFLVVHGLSVYLGHPLLGFLFLLLLVQS